MNVTQAYNQQRDTLKYVMEELKKILLDIKAEIIATSDPLSLQGIMVCKQEPIHALTHPGSLQWMHRYLSALTQKMETGQACMVKADC